MAWLQPSVGRGGGYHYGTSQRPYCICRHRELFGPLTSCRLQGMIRDVQFLFRCGFLIVPGRFVSKCGRPITQFRSLDRFVVLQVLPSSPSKATHNGFAAFISGVRPTTPDCLGRSSAECGGNLNEVSRLGVSIVHLPNASIFKASNDGLGINARLSLFCFQVKFNRFGFVITSIANRVHQGSKCCPLRMMFISRDLCFRIKNSSLSSVFTNDGKLTSLNVRVTRLSVSKDFCLRIFRPLTCRNRTTLRIASVLIRTTSLTFPRGVILPSTFIGSFRLYPYHFMLFNDRPGLLFHCRLLFSGTTMLLMAPLFRYRFLVRTSTFLFRPRVFLLRTSTNVTRLILLVNRVNFTLRSSSIRRQVTRAGGRVTYLSSNSFLFRTLFRATSFCHVRVGSTIKRRLSSGPSMVARLSPNGYDGNRPIFFRVREEKDISRGGMGGGSRRCRNSNSNVVVLPLRSKLTFSRYVREWLLLCVWFAFICGIVSSNHERAICRLCG